jgi:hypothetical protein
MAMLHAGYAQQAQTIALALRLTSLMSGGTSM